MKKLLALCMIGVCFCGYAVFAETTVSGLFMGGVTIIGGTTEKELDDDGEEKSKKPNAGNILAHGRIQLTSKNEEGTVGGVVRVNAKAPWYDATGIYAWGWWQPLQQIKVQIGWHDGVFGVNNLVGWGFHANDAEDTLDVYHGPSTDPLKLSPYEKGRFTVQTRNTGFYTGFSDVWGASLTVTPIAGLTLGFGAPYTITNWTEQDFTDAYMHFHAHASYAIGSIGKIALSYVNGKNEVAGVYGEGLDGSNLYLSFYLTAVEKLGVNIGLQYVLPAKNGDDTYYSPIVVGLGASYALFDMFTLKVRAALQAGGKYEPNVGDSTDDPISFGLDILPVIDFGFAKLNVNLGIEFTSEKKNANGDTVEDAAFGVGINPYLTKSIGPATIYCGVDVRSSGKKYTLTQPDPSDPDNIKVIEKEPPIVWKIPIGMAYSF
ncbi:MAG: hypothetical protein LBG87_06720 [Spirochaetaceae bacterium]|jgi:hypothetical protein|nr:hypothetical protein [Spirochaetaceae bacterium]